MEQITLLFERMTSLRKVFFFLALGLSLALLSSSLSMLMENTNYNEELIPLCTTNIFDKRITSLDPLQTDHLIVNQPDETSGYCKLHYYTHADTVACLDDLKDDLEMNSSEDRNNETASEMRKKFHISFVGDSRIRQMYKNMVKLLLPHIEDSCGHHLSDGENYHGGPRQIEQCVEDPFLDVFVSFHWIDILDEKFVKLVTDWTNGSYTNGSRSTPNYIIIGNALHHMGLYSAGKDKERSHKSYQDKVTRALTLFHQLTEQRSEVFKIVWWIQDNTLSNQIKNIAAFNGLFGPDKMLGYNEIVRKSFLSNYKSWPNGKPLRIWDSTNAIFLEHYRMCELDGSTRNAPNTDVDHVSAWVRCTEVLHPAQTINIIHDQLILNDLCNNFMLEKADKG